MTAPPPDPTRCPLCGGPNECGMAAGANVCWCFDAKISTAILSQVPEGARGKACVCRACATGARQKSLPLQPRDED